MDKSAFRHYLQDKHGRLYTVNIVSQSDGFFSAYIHYKHMAVGRINWLVEDESKIVTLADLVIFDPPTVRRPLWATLLPFLKWQPPSFRHCGLGSAMLRYVIEQAETIAVEGISGFITSDDLQLTSYLLTFYEKHGFVVKRSPQNTRGAAATIYREVR